MGKADRRKTEEPLRKMDDEFIYIYFREEER